MRRLVSSATLRIITSRMGIGITISVTGVITATDAVWPIRRRARIVADAHSVIIGTRARGSGIIIGAGTVTDRGATESD